MPHTLSHCITPIIKGSKATVDGEMSSTTLSRTLVHPLSHCRTCVSYNLTLSHTHHKWPHFQR